MVGNEISDRKSSVKVSEIRFLFCGTIVLLVLLVTTYLAGDIKPSPLTVNYMHTTSMAFNQEYMYLAIEEQGMFAITRATGKIAWQLPTDELFVALEEVALALLLTEDKLYLRYSTGVLALDSNNGVLVWKLPLGIAPSAPVNMLSVAELLLITNPYSGWVYLINGTRGEVVWMYDFSLVANNRILPLSLSSDRVVILVGDIERYDGDYIFSKGELYVFSVVSGELLWTQDLADWITTPFLFVPAIKDVTETMYLVLEHNILALDGTKGVLQWQAQSPGWYTDLILVADKLVALGGSTAIFTVDRVSGERLCRESIYPGKSQRSNDFLVQNDRYLYWVHHTIEQQRILWWYVPIRFEQSELYVAEAGSCRFELSASIKGRLLTYDPVTRKGMIVPGAFSDLAAIKEIQVLP